jgi:hypothetical protein
MNLKTLQIVRNELLQKKLIAENNIDITLMDNSLDTKQKTEKIIKELDDLKNSSLMINFWEEYIDTNIILPNTEDNNEK